MARPLPTARKTFPGSEIYSFEPSPSTFDQLNAIVGGLPNVHAFNAGMGSQDGKLRLRENTNSVMSSFLEPGPAAWGHVVRESLVDVWTVDGFSEMHRIERVTVLKTDTQGFDLEVLRGAERMITGSAVDIILAELTFVPMYEDAPRFDTLVTHVLDRGFRLVGVYATHQGRLAGWADMLFAHERLF